MTWVYSSGEMKKAIGIIFLGLLLSGNANASSIWDYLNIGMTKKELNKITDPFWAYTQFHRSMEFNGVFPGPSFY